MRKRFYYEQDEQVEDKNDRFKMRIALYRLRMEGNPRLRGMGKIVSRKIIIIMIK